MTPLVLLLAAHPAVPTELRTPVRPGWPELGGTWALVQVTSAVSDAPLIGRVTTETQVWSLLELHQVGSELDLGPERVCSLDTSDPTPFVSTEYPPAFLEAVDGGHRRARLERNENGMLRFVQPGSWKIDGAALAAPEEPLPRTLEDPRLRDPDRDGQPGLTIRVNGIASGDLYVVSRGWTELLGAFRSDGTIRGRVRWRTEQSVVGVTNGILDHQPNPSPHPDPNRSWFALVPVAHDTTCAALLDRASRIEERIREDS